MAEVEVLDQRTDVCFDFVPHESLEVWRKRSLRKERPTSKSRYGKAEQQNGPVTAFCRHTGSCIELDSRIKNAIDEP